MKFVNINEVTFEDLSNTALSLAVDEGFLVFSDAEELASYMAKPCSCETPKSPISLGIVQAALYGINECRTCRRTIKKDSQE